MRLLIDNYLNDATLTVNKPTPAFPEENINNDSPIERVQFDDYIVIDLGSAMDVDSIGYLNSNVSITIQANTSDSWGSPAFSQALTQNVTFITTETYRYWRIYTNTSTSRLGYFYLGEHYEFPGHVGNNVSAPLTTDVIGVTSSRQIYNTPGIVYNEESVEFPLCSLEERNEFETWYRTSDRAKNHLYIPFEEDMVNFPPYFARLTNYTPTRDLCAFSWGITLSEVYNGN